MHSDSPAIEPPSIKSPLQFLKDVAYFLECHEREHAKLLGARVNPDYMAVLRRRTIQVQALLRSLQSKADQQASEEPELDDIVDILLQVIQLSAPTDGYNLYWRADTGEFRLRSDKSSELPAPAYLRIWTYDRRVSRDALLSDVADAVTTAAELNATRGGGGDSSGPVPSVQREPDDAVPDPLLGSMVVSLVGLRTPSGTMMPAGRPGTIVGRMPDGRWMVRFKYAQQAIVVAESSIDITGGRATAITRPI